MQCTRIIFAMQNEIYTSKYNWLANLSVGVVWKIGNNKKKENLMCASARSVMPLHFR